MFVSSYSTYINPNTISKYPKDKVSEGEVKQKSSFHTAFTSTTVVQQTSSNLPLNYISNYKVLSNQQKMHQDLQQKTDSQNFKKLQKFSSATEAYSYNKKLFSVVPKPHIAIDMTPKINKRLPKEAQTMAEKSLRSTMINTYLANDKYYQITAA